jgi:hypothetical protein
LDNQDLFDQQHIFMCSIFKENLLTTEIRKALLVVQKRKLANNNA